MAQPRHEPTRVPADRVGLEPRPAVRGVGGGHIRWCILMGPVEFMSRDGPHEVEQDTPSPQTTHNQHAEDMFDNKLDNQSWVAREAKPGSWTALVGDDNNAVHTVERAFALRAVTQGGVVDVDHGGPRRGGAFSGAHEGALGAYTRCGEGGAG